jgi:hypothetical protein
MNKFDKKKIDSNYFLPTANINCIAPLTSKQMKPNTMLIDWHRASGSNGGLNHMKEIYFSFLFSLWNLSKLNKQLESSNNGQNKSLIFIFLIILTLNTA